MKRSIAAFAAVAAATWAAAVFTGAGVAHADDHYTYVPLPADELFWPTDEAPLPFLWVGGYLQKGESRRVTDQLEISQNALEPGPEVDNEVQCIDNLGDEQDVDNGTNYLEGGQAYQWNVSMLLTNQGPQEAFYLCKVLLHLDTGFPMAVLAPAAGQTTYGTWLEISSSPDTGAQQWYYPYWPGSQCICCSDDADSTVNPSPCVYIGGPNPNSNSIDYWPNPDGSYQYTWSASDDAAVVDFVATAQVTVCFQYSKSCRRIDETDPGHYSKISSGLEIQQQYPAPAGSVAGRACGAPTVAYSEDTVAGTADTQETLTVSKYQHHLPLYYHATVPVSQLCGGAHFHARLYTQLISGPPIKYDGANLNVIILERCRIVCVNAPPP